MLGPLNKGSAHYRVHRSKVCISSWWVIETKICQTNFLKSNRLNKKHQFFEQKASIGIISLNKASPRKTSRKIHLELHCGSSLSGVAVGTGHRLQTFDAWCGRVTLWNGTLTHWCNNDDCNCILSFHDYSDGAGRWFCCWHHPQPAFRLVQFSCICSHSHSQNLFYLFGQHHW